MRKPKMKPVVIGYYDRLGYRVWRMDTSEELYTGGNCHYDSTTVFDPGSPGAYSLAQIRSGCIKTTREIAEEEGLEYGGVEREEDVYERF